MIRSLFITLAFSLIAASTANAHFVFIVPDKGGETAKVILSEDLEPDLGVHMEVITDLKLISTDLAGHDAPVKLNKADHAYSIDLDEGQAGVVHGIADGGIYQHGDSKPCRLTYYPKTVLGDPFDPNTILGKNAPIELVPTGKAGKLKFQLLVDAKPVADAEIDIILPDGSDQKDNTDKDGFTTVFEAPGRYGVWARNIEPIAGELNGKHFDETRKYATLVIDVPAPSTASAYIPMPQAASSFGAVACDGWVYLYGGHTANTHAYSTDSVSGQFHRLNLADPKSWETLPGGPPLQGLNLATWHGKIYRVGGMNPRNKAKEPADVRSVADCACFDPATKTWTPLPPLPDPRSSHDLAVVGDKLIVVGGWNLTGDADDAKWFDTMLTLDLSSPNPQWTSLPQPFERRAFIAASYQNKLYIIGGFQTESEPTKRVDIYDPATNSWTEGPELPGKDQNGFGPAACTLNGKLFVSVADGTVYRLDPAGSTWEKIGTGTPRIVHRMVPGVSQLLIIGGAAKQKQLDLIEAIQLPAEK